MKNVDIALQKPFKKKSWQKNDDHFCNPRHLIFKTEKKTFYFRNRILLNFTEYVNEKWEIKIYKA